MFPIPANTLYSTAPMWYTTPSVKPDLRTSQPYHSAHDRQQHNLLSLTAQLVSSSVELGSEGYGLPGLPERVSGMAKKLHCVLPPDSIRGATSSRPTISSAI